MMPVLASFGPFHLYSYGLAVATGVLIALALMRRATSQGGFPSSDQVYDLVFFVLASGFLGARIFYVAQHAPWYLGHPLEILAFWQGGLVFYGGMIVSSAGLWVYCRKKKMSFLGVLDFLTPYVAFVHAFGRIGCFLNGCCYGDPCDLPWAVKFPGMERAVHPTQLYEAVFNFALFLFLRGLYRRYRVQSLSPEPGTSLGRVTAAYFFLYAVARFLFESLRFHENLGWLLTWNQWISLGVMAAVAAWQFKGTDPRNSAGPVPKSHGQVPGSRLKS